MKKVNIEIGRIYLAKISGRLVPVDLLHEHFYGGWTAKNMLTGRHVRIKTAAKLRRELDPEVARNLVNAY